MRTVAARRNGGWVINGSKNFITNATFAGATVALAITDRPAGSHGISAFIVERGTQGFSVSKKENKLGMRASDTASLVFDDCFVPDANLVGDAGQGFIHAMRVLDGGRISIAALAVGTAQGAYEAALRYSTERYQFGRPIAEFQAIQFKLADMATQIDAARLLTFRSAAMKNRGKVTTKESSMAKLYASEVAVRVAEESVQIHGGYGFIKDYPAEKYWRDSKLCTIGEGTSEIQRMVIARQLLRA
jgi:alkylation response protein AidB-like acyl-CoA dehydrogenase